MVIWLVFTSSRTGQTWTELWLIWISIRNTSKLSTQNSCFCPTLTTPQRTLTNNRRFRRNLFLFFFSCIRSAARFVSDPLATQTFLSHHRIPTSRHEFLTLELHFYGVKIGLEPLVTSCMLLRHCCNISATAITISKPPQNEGTIKEMFILR
jgi:hypothetical protein